MADDILSAEELEALLATVEDESSGKRTRQKRIVDYDFVRPNKLSGEQVRSLQRLHETIAQNLTMVLASYLRVNLEVNLISLGQLTFDVFRNSLSNPTMINVLSMNPVQEACLATMDMKLAFSLVDRMLGGPGKALARMRPLTMLEQSLLDNVVQRFLTKLKEGWSSLLEFDPQVQAREMDPQFVQVIPSSEMVLVTTFTLQAPGELETGEMCFCIPFISLDAVISKLDFNFQFAAAARRQTERQREYLDRVVGDTAVSLEVRLGTTRLGLGEVLSLKEGDVLVLDQAHDQALQGFLRGRLKLTGRPGHVGRHVGLLVEEVVPEGDSPGRLANLLPGHAQRRAPEPTTAAPRRTPGASHG
jgi:flagellar motor switch protein FliM